jgi:hypothetical protein
MVAFHKELVQDPDYRSGLNKLTDMRQANIDSQSNEIEEIVSDIANRSGDEGDRKVAFLVGRNNEFGLARMIDMMTDQTQTALRPFWRLDDALAWLGLPETLGDPFETMDQGQLNHGKSSPISRI